MSDPKDVMARLKAMKAGTATQKETKTKTRTTVSTTERSFEITEAEIKSNPAYQIITDEKLNDKEKLEALHDLKCYKAELTKEENEINREASQEMLLYIENQLMASAQKGVEFTNDNAFALYDETIQELFSNIKIFKGYIEPFVKALEVLQKARDADIPANELIEAVSEMQGEIADMKASKESKAEDIVTLQGERDGFNAEATRIAEKLESLTAAIEEAKSDKTDAEKSWNIFTRGKAITAAQDNITGFENQVATLSDTARIKTENLDRLNEQLKTLEDEVVKLDADILTKEEEFASNEDSMAIATLIEITGEDFKTKREEVVNSAKSITDKAIEGIEKSIGRFKDGETEVSTQLNTITNLNGMVGLMAKADKEVRVSDAKFISEQREIVDRIKAEKGDDAIADPDYERAKKHLDAANEHVEDVISSANRAADLEGKLTRQSGTFKGLRDAYDQKEQDATKLRTSAAVEIPAQLAITVKSVEMATATESNNMVNDAFADLSKTTQEAVGSIFDTVSAGLGQNNEQLRATLEQTMSTIEMMNSVQKDLQTKAAEGVEIREGLDMARGALKDVTDEVKSAVVDADNDGMLQEEAPQAAGDAQ